MFLLTSVLCLLVHKMSAELVLASGNNATPQETTIGGSKPLHRFIKRQPKIIGVRYKDTPVLKLLIIISLLTMTIIISYYYLMTIIGCIEFKYKADVKRSCLKLFFFYFPLDHCVGLGFFFLHRFLCDQARRSLSSIGGNPTWHCARSNGW